MTEESISEKVFRFLEGEWGIRRQFKGSYGGDFSGHAVFESKTNAPSTYHYSEQGELVDSEGKRFAAKQTYRYLLKEGQVEILKQEGSDWIVMHGLDLKDDGGVATASHVHLCGQDHYATIYRVDFSGSLEVEYSVKGPNKGYSIHTTFKR